jgi:hypothetical protein
MNSEWNREQKNKLSDKELSDLIERRIKSYSQCQMETEKLAGKIKAIRKAYQLDPDDPINYRNYMELKRSGKIK